MKKTALIVILSVVIVVLSLVLYIFIETSPKQIKSEEPGTMYTFGEISFNLTSDKYQINQSIIDAAEERGMDISNMAMYTNEETGKSITIFREQGDTEVSAIIDDSIAYTRNPFTHLQLEKELPDKMETEVDIEKVELDLYLGEDNKYGVLQKNIDSSKNIIYILDLKIGPYFYTIITNAPYTNNIEDLMEFLRTVHINNN